MPSPDVSPSLLHTFLSRLETTETELLAWGAVNGGFTDDEVAEVAQQVIDALDSEGTTRVEDLVRAARERSLLHDFQDFDGDRYRTRMAETVRLLSTLRQLFPGKPWHAAPSLVADFRLSVRPRRFPVRDTTAGQLREHLGVQGLRLTRLQQRALDALLLADTGRPLLLSAFQAEATRRLLEESLDHARSRGLLVSAGTGSGKTLAFYLPAFLSIVDHVERARYWTKVVAFYPRNELLKDQITSAIDVARRLDGVLAPSRPVVAAALYGDTPTNAEDLNEPAPGQAPRNAKMLRAWPRETLLDGRTGRRCPFLRVAATGVAYVWLDEDRTRGIERLVPLDGNGPIVEPTHIRLTRTRMVDEPADLLFTTTEMANRYLGHSTYGPLFGVGAVAPPRFVLLDEAHTYTETAGAQTAYLLRRYRHALGTSHPHFVGLSATLAEPQAFFADLTGLLPSSIATVDANDPLYPTQEIGHEYAIVLRSNPVSGAPVLATTIQTILLLRRMLDPLSVDTSHGFYGSRLFAFLDNLDVTNRLFDSLGDAEGLKRRYGALEWEVNPQKDPLAALRLPDPTRDADSPEERAREQAGQIWTRACAIGHQLGVRPQLGRVSSQDPGVNDRADVIVATSSLEVGFDDDRVGAVVQHKAPRDVASFLQRRGRAGRTQTMRPWTAVVLSDFGRDRAAYQAYETLFAPIVQVRRLPLGNRYVLRMQATFAYLDWLGTHYRRSRRGERPNSFNPWEACGNAFEGFGQQRTWIAGVTREILEAPSGERSQDLQRHLQTALGISEDEVRALLWDPPRALLTGALPTLLRRLETTFRRWSPDPDADLTESTLGGPLPGFVPTTLFSDLNLPEVEFDLFSDRRQRNGTPFPPRTVGALAVHRALSEGAPGRVTRRFSAESARDLHWLPINLQDVSPIQALAVESVCSVPPDELGRFGYRAEDGSEVWIRVVRPVALRLAIAPSTVQPSSNARPTWRTQILPSQMLAEGDLGWHTVSGLLPAHRAIHRVVFYMHRFDTHAEVRRFTDRAHASVLLQSGTRLEPEVRYQATGLDGDTHPVALGYVQAVDAVAFHVVVPPAAALRARTLDQAERARSARTAYFRYEVLRAPELADLNFFQRGFLADAFLATLVEHAAAMHSLQEALVDLVEQDALSRGLQNTLDTTLGATVDDESGEVGRERGLQRLAELVRSGHPAQVLATYAPVLWEAPGAAFDAWLTERYVSTLGAALLEACTLLTPGTAESGLLLDLDAGPQGEDAPALDPDTRVLWISESTLGGTGLVEAIADAYTADPRRFMGLVRHALAATDVELASLEYDQFLRRLPTSDALAAALAQVRESQGMEELRQAQTDLRTSLLDHGLLPTHAFVSMVQTRLLRPGSSEHTDRLSCRLREAWDALEGRLGVEVDARIAAHVLATDPQVIEMLEALPMATDDTTWRFGVVYSLLWARGATLRERALTPYSPFVDLPPADRLLLLDHWPDAADRVRVDEDADEDAWFAYAQDRLAHGGTVRLMASAGDRARLAAALTRFVLEPVALDYLLAYPRVDDVRREHDDLVVTLTLAESLQ